MKIDMKKFVLIILMTIVSISCDRQYNTESDVPRQFSSVQHFEYSGHKYIMFTIERALPAASSNIVHDPDCPCQKKDTVYINRGKHSNDLNITYREKTIQDDIIKFLVDEFKK